MATKYRAHPKQAEAHRSHAKRRILLWGRQVGKSLWAVNEAWVKGVEHQGRYLIVFPTYKQAKQTIWNQYIHYIPQALIKEVNNTELTVTLHHLRDSKLRLPGSSDFITINHDEDLPPTTIELVGSDDADRLRGIKANGLIFDEYALHDPENWTTVFEPMLSTTDGWAAFISTPKGFNHFYEMVLDVEKGRKHWWLSKATWRDNPAISTEFIARVRQEAEEKGSLSAFMQEYELEFRSVEGAVYPEFDRNVHVVDPSEVPVEGDIFACVDFGWDAPTAVNFVKIDGDGNWWLFDEIHVIRTQVVDVAAMMKNKMMGQRLILAIGDSAQQESINVMQTAGIPVLPAAKTRGADNVSSVSLGIGLITEKLKPRIQLIGEPRPKLFVSTNCRNTIEEFEGYKYPSVKADRNPSELPLKHNDHHMDALRYLAMHFKYGIMKEEKTPTSGAPKFNEYGLLS